MAACVKAATAASMVVGVGRRHAVFKELLDGLVLGRLRFTHHRLVRQREVEVREITELDGGALFVHADAGLLGVHQIRARFGDRPDDVVAVLVALAFPLLSAVVGDLRDSDLGIGHALARRVDDFALDSARLGEGGRRKDRRWPEPSTRL